MTIKVKIPKRVGGVKLGKKIRRKAKKAIRMAESGFAAAAMGAAARAARCDRQSESVREAGERIHRLCSETRVDIDASKVGEAFRAAAIDGLRRFLEGFEEGLRDAAAPAETPADEAPAEEAPAAEAAEPAPPRPPRPSRPARPSRPPRPGRPSRPGRPPADAAPE